MICIQGEDRYRFKDTVVTIGKFDALHIGHRALIARMEPLKAKGMTTLVFRLDIRNGAESLRTEAERIGILEEAGVDIYICREFTEKEAAVSAEEFVRETLAGQLGVRAVVVGEDFRFGHDRQGDTAFLRSAGIKYGFETIVVPRVFYGGEEVSSSRIRRALREGKTAEARAMLGIVKETLI